MFIQNINLVSVACSDWPTTATRVMRGDSLFLRVAKVAALAFSAFCIYSVVSRRLERSNLQTLRDRIERYYLLVPDPHSSTKTTQILRLINFKVPSMAPPEMDLRINQIVRLINHNTHISDKCLSHILRRIDPVCTTQLSAWVDQAKRLMYQEMNDFDQMTVVQGLSTALLIDRSRLVIRSPELLRTHNKDLIEKTERLIDQALLLIAWDMNGFERRQILLALGKIPEKRRDEITHRVQQQIVEQQDLNGQDIANKLCDEAGVPQVLQIAEMFFFRTRGRLGVDIHSRDQLTRLAWEQFCLYQGSYSDTQIKKNVTSCLTYFRSMQTDDAIFIKAWVALHGPRPPQSPWGPILDVENEDTTWSVHGLDITGQQVIGRLWGYIQSIPETQDRNNALHEMKLALSDCYEQGFLVCNPGKLQKLMIALIQGRVPGIMIDRPDSEQVPVGQALTLFLTTQVAQNLLNQERITQTQLIELGKMYLKENPRINRAEFIKELNQYYTLQNDPSLG